MIVKVTQIDNEVIYFSGGFNVSSEHDQDCCERHYMETSDLKIEDFEGLEFDLSGDFFKRIDDYGIELIPINGHSVKIPCYASNNGYYSNNLSLVLCDGSIELKRFDITECQQDN